MSSTGRSRNRLTDVIAGVSVNFGQVSDLHGGGSVVAAGEGDGDVGGRALADRALSGEGVPPVEDSLGVDAEVVVQVLVARRARVELHAKATHRRLKTVL